MKISDTDEEYYDIMRFLPIIKKISHYNNYFVSHYFTTLIK